MLRITADSGVSVSESSIRSVHGPLHTLKHQASVSSSIRFVKSLFRQARVSSSPCFVKPLGLTPRRSRRGEAARRSAGGGSQGSWAAASWPPGGRPTQKGTPHGRRAGTACASSWLPPRRTRRDRWSRGCSALGRGWSFRRAAAPAVVRSALGWPPRRAPERRGRLADTGGDQGRAD